MKIAIIGWGSLIWDPRELKITSRWRADGPSMPVEFSRVSINGRLTLVIDIAAEPVTTYWAESKYTELSDARENLRLREGTKDLKHIHSSTASQTDSVTPAGVGKYVASWLEQKQYHAAIWTGLQGNLGSKDLPADPVEYLSSLKGDARKLAKEYVCNAPEQVRTAVRSRIQEELSWSPAILDPELFEINES